MFPPAFLDRMKELGLDSSIYEKYPRKSVHILKDEEEIVRKFKLEPVPWAKNCFFIDEPRIVQEQFYCSVFVQDPASVVPVLALDAKSVDCVADLCAAPGSKTLHLVRTAKHVIANDSNHRRIMRLEHNLKRFNIENCKIMCRDGKKLRFNKQADRVLVDAPCSGEGIVGKIHKTVKLWSLKRIKMLSRTQKQLVLNGINLLKKGGVLVYSTCTFAPEENEEVVDYVVRKGDCELEQISIDHLAYIHGLTSWKEREYDESLRKTIRIYPFHNCTNGFFVAKFRKVKE